MCSPDNVLNKVLIVAGTVEHKVLPRLGIVVLASLRRAAAAAAADVDLEVNLSRDNIATLRHEVTNTNTTTTINTTTTTHQAPGYPGVGQHQAAHHACLL